MFYHFLFYHNNKKKSKPVKIVFCWLFLPFSFGKILLCRCKLEPRSITGLINVTWKRSQQVCQLSLAFITNLSFHFSTTIPLSHSSKNLRWGPRWRGCPEAPAADTCRGAGCPGSPPAAGTSHHSALANLSNRRQSPAPWTLTRQEFEHGKDRVKRKWIFLTRSFDDILLLGILQPVSTLLD